MNRETTSNVCCGMGGVVCGLAFLLWLGLAPVLSGLSLLGLKMASMSPIVLPLAIVALGLISSGLWLGAKSHGHGEPFMVSLVGAAATVLGMTVAPAVATFGLLIVAGSIGWNQLLLSRRQRVAHKLDRKFRRLSCPASYGSVKNCMITRHNRSA